MNRTFSNWKKWTERADLIDLNYPGIYVLAMSPDISGQPFSWRKEIVYVGMTNAIGGLKSRLKQFDKTIKTPDGVGHGGGARFRGVHTYDSALGKLHVSICPQKCDVKSNLPEDLRVMGEVASHEYECKAEYVARFGRLPDFNDPKRFPKKYG